VRWIGVPRATIAIRRAFPAAIGIGIGIAISIAIAIVPAEAMHLRQVAKAQRQPMPPGIG
jgi:predicted sugar kinase